jgi:hypothetical protein
MISSLSLLDRRQKESHFQGWLRSWVQIPPGPLLSVVQIRYYFERILDNCRTNPATLASHAFYANSLLILLLCCASEEITPRRPIALPIRYTISKAISVGTKPTVKNIAASPKFIT